MGRYNVDEDKKNYVCPCRNKACICCSIVFLMVLVITIIVSTMIGLRYNRGRSFTNSGLDYGPTETRLIPYSYMFCQGLRLENKYSGSQGYNLSLHLLADDPFLSEQNVITISSIKEYNSKEWYYIHSGSHVTVNACYDNSRIYEATYLTLNIARGVSKSVEKRFSFSSCEAGGNVSLSYIFEEEGFYYILFYSDCRPYCSLSLNLNFSIFITNYNSHNNTVVSSCSISTSKFGSSCSVNVPYNKNYALLMIQPDNSSDVEIYDKISLETKCEPRVWLYVVPSILSAFLMLCCLTCCNATLCYMTVNTCRKCAIYSTVLLLLFLIISITLAVRFHSVSRYYINHGNDSSPTDTRLIPISNTFCESLIVKTSYNGSNEYNASLYLLSNKQLKLSREQFIISDNIAADFNHHYLFYLNRDSNITIDACFVQAGVVIPGTSLFIARGIDGYDGGHRLSGIKHFIEKPILYDCFSNVSTVQFSARYNDFYYFIFFTTTRGYVPKLNLNVTMYFNLTQYNRDHSTSSCSISTSEYGSECSLQLPLYETNYALLTVDPASSDVDLLDKVPLEAHCIIRLWIFIVPPFLFVSLLPGLTCFYIIMLERPGNIIRQLLLSRTHSPSYTQIRLASISETHRVKRKFKRAWCLKKAPLPSVIAVFSIQNKWREFIHMFFRGSEEYYHGTKLDCDIVNTETLCNSNSCGICSIAQSGFDKDKIGTNITRFQRFGPGFYLAPNSSKSNDYNNGKLDVKAMLLCNVYPGRKYVRSKTEESLDGPPSGYDSIYGIVGNSLNYREILIPSSDTHSIHPLYIIVYREA